MTANKAYIARYSVFSAMILSLSVLFYFFAPDKYIADAYLFIVPFFYFTGLISRLILLRAARKNASRFSLAYMAISTARLVFFSLILIVYALFFRHDAYPFMIAFFIHYVIFSLFEIVSMYRSMHKSV